MKVDKFLITIILIIALAAVLMLANAHNSSPHPASSPSISSSPPSSQLQISKLKNLTYEYLYSPSANKKSTVMIFSVNSISVNSSVPKATPGEQFKLTVLYNGTFNFNSGQYNSSAFLGNTIDLYYFGYKQQGAKNLLVYYNLANVSKYFILSSTNMSIPNGSSPVNYLQENAILTPTLNASHKTWEFCGGIFVTFINNTNSGQIFSRLSFNMTDVSNSTVIDFASDNCASVVVS